jgi:regulator of sirC expression with transglutaminase-like and TPR domain
MPNRKSAIRTLSLRVDPGRIEWWMLVDAIGQFDPPQEARNAGVGQKQCYDEAMSHQPRHDPPLAAVVRDGHVACSLEEAALVLARQEYPDLELSPWLERLDSMADRAAHLVSAHADPAEIIGAVSDVLFRDLQFHGNTANYEDPRNSFLNDVIERRTGIPITLSVIYMAVARRLALQLRGTGFPGHFLVVLPRDGWPIVIDAFDRGRILSREDCKRLAARLGFDWDPSTLDPVTDVKILRRMLNNLKGIYTASHDWERLLRTSNQILVVTPGDIDEQRVQAVALVGLGETAAAIAALERYLKARPFADDAGAVRDLLQRLRAELR